MEIDAVAPAFAVIAAAVHRDNVQSKGHEARFAHGSRTPLDPSQGTSHAGAHSDITRTASGQGAPREARAARSRSASACS
ncbi:MAG TPA: hypothetical protein VNM39_02650, partial [Verrucomicrobiae bacterium]|nr:hypothetical protein [Verrucomicrobiae bacterium]